MCLTRVPDAPPPPHLLRVPQVTFFKVHMGHKKGEVQRLKPLGAKSPVTPTATPTEVAGLQMPSWSPICKSGVQWNLYIKTTLGTNNVWSLHTGVFICRFNNKESIPLGTSVVVVPVYIQGLYRAGLTSCRVRFKPDPTVTYTTHCY